MNRIVHLGLGNFHRAHQAWYTAQIDDWKITGVVMRNQALFDDLSAHDNAYLLGTWGVKGLTVQTIDIYDDVVLASQTPTAVIDQIADAETHVITLTITEKGYGLRGPDGRIDLAAPGIISDLNSETPSTAIGLLCAGIIARAATNGAPLTIISCDNLADNGHKLGQAVADYLAVKSPETLPWLTQNVTFPTTMVDRITPQLTPNAKTEIIAAAGGVPLSVVGTERFSEWVIEDKFAGPRPAWDTAGALFVADVAAFEARKLRLLNASHSFLAYAGQLAGHRFVHEAIADPILRAAVDTLWDEAAATIPPPAAETLDDYRAALLARFAVPAMRHALAQIAMDGSLKLRERIVPIIHDRAENGQASPQARKAVASWIAFVCDSVEKGTPLQDPNTAEITLIVTTHADSADRTRLLQDLIGLES